MQESRVIRHYSQLYTHFFPVWTSSSFTTQGRVPTKNRSPQSQRVDKKSKHNFLFFSVPMSRWSLSYYRTDYWQKRLPLIWTDGLCMYPSLEVKSVVRRWHVPFQSVVARIPAGAGVIAAAPAPSAAAAASAIIARRWCSAFAESASSSSDCDLIKLLVKSVFVMLVSIS